MSGNSTRSIVFLAKALFVYTDLFYSKEIIFFYGVIVYIMVVFDNDTLLIKTNCDQKFRFFCNFMANCVKVKQDYFTNIACPSKVENGNGDSIEKSSINILVDPFKFEQIEATYVSCPINVTYSNKCIEYGLVLYEHRKIRFDTRWPLENLIEDFKKNPSSRESFFYVGQDLNKMIKKMIEIRTDNFDKDKTSILFPIYNVGTCNTSNHKTNDDEYFKLMYFMFIAGIYNFFEILKEFLLRKYKNDLKKDNKSKVIFEALQRMYIQVNQICDSFYEKTPNEGITAIKTKLKLEYEYAFIIVEEGYNMSLGIDYSDMCSMPYASSNSGGYNMGTVLGIAGLAGLGLYGLKKWRELKGVSSSSSSSSGSLSSSSSDSSSSSSSSEASSKVHGVGRGRGRGRGRGKSSGVVRQSARLKAASGKKGRVTVRAKSSGEVKGVRQSARLKAAADLKGASKSARLKSKRV